MFKRATKPSTPVRRPKLPGKTREPTRKELEEWYKTEITKRDRLIQGLREKNHVLMTSSMKRSEEIENLKKQLKNNRKKET